MNKLEFCLGVVAIVIILLSLVFVAVFSSPYILDQKSSFVLCACIIACASVICFFWEDPEQVITEKAKEQICDLLESNFKQAILVRFKNYGTTLKIIKEDLKLIVNIDSVLENDGTYRIDSYHHITVYKKGTIFYKKIVHRLKSEEFSNVIKRNHNFIFQLVQPHLNVETSRLEEMLKTKSEVIREAYVSDKVIQPKDNRTSRMIKTAEVLNNKKEK